MSLADGLVDLWDFAGPSAPAGPTVLGLAAGTPMTLRRTPRTDGGSGSIASGWIVDTDGERYFNGQGFVELDSPLPFTAAGHEITLVCWWSSLPPHPMDGIDVMAHILGAAGTVALDADDHGVWLRVNSYNMGGGSEWVRSVFIEQGGETSFSDGIVDPSGMGTLASRFVWALVLKVHTPSSFYFPDEATADVFCGGVQLASGYLLDNHLETAGTRNIDADRFGFGDYRDSQAGFRRAALYSRALSPTEIADIGGSPGDDLVESLTDEEAGPGTANPLLNADGTLGLNIEWPVSRTLAGVGVIASPDAVGAAGRHTRRTHERAAGGLHGRRYELTFNAANANDVRRIREALAVTAGGAALTRFRHPVDDAPGRVKDAPQVRVIEVSGLERNRGGQIGKGKLVLEYA